MALSARGPLRDARDRRHQTRAQARHPSRRRFLQQAALGAVAFGATTRAAGVQIAGDRPAQSADVRVLNPRGRVPVGLIIDDSTCLVNLNRFAMPQFDTAFGGTNKAYHRDWRSWPVEIPDAFVRKFGEWCAGHGVKGKYSVVPYPACVGRLDRGLPGWTARELQDSIALVRSLLMPNWDIHPEMVTHTRIIDTSTGHPYPDHSRKFMENWDWTTGRSADEIADYMVYALEILKNAGLPCEGVTTPGGFGARALPELAQATLESVRDVFGAEVPHYFRHVYDRGDESVAPRVEYASGLDTADPRCVVSIIACTGDWTGGWDNTPPAGADRFITGDLQHGRMVDVILRGEPALMLAHWTGFYWNGEELGLKVFQEVVGRLHARFDHLIWMKLSALARYWAAKELTRIERDARGVALHAPFACPEFTVSLAGADMAAPTFSTDRAVHPLARIASPGDLSAGAWVPSGRDAVFCVDLPKGSSRIDF
jgi:hypothetical protein